MSNDIKLSNCQQEALDGYLDFLFSDDPWMVISGFAGSGKSFLVNYMTDVAKNAMALTKTLNKDFLAPRVYYTATTNKAASVLEHIVNEPVQTVHKLMGLKVTNDYRTGKTRLERTSKPCRTPNSVIIIDEASMINSQLLVAIKEHQLDNDNCKLVFIGDPYQLPPVLEPPCPVFKAEERHYFLNEIQRQVAGNPIIQLSSKYRDVLDNPEQDWPTIPADNQNIFFYEDEGIFQDAIQQVMQRPHDPTQYKVLAWANQRVIDYNKWIRKLQGRTQPYELNEIIMTNKPLIIGNEVKASTDSLHRITNIMVTHDYQVPGFLITLESVRYQTTFQGFQPLNWRHAQQLLKQLAEAKNWYEYFLIKDTWMDLRPIHALTCHKAQGSTYKEVFVDLNDIARNTRWTEAARLAYVAVTRASDVLHVYGNLGRCNYPSKRPAEEVFSNVDHLVQ